MRSVAFAAFGLALVVPSVPALGAPRVAVQPFGGPETEPYRREVAKVVARHGFKVVTSLARVSGTSQYPGLAKERGLSAFVVADVEDRGERVALSFLVWQGIDGSVIGRWEVSGSKKTVTKRIGSELWRRLGAAIGKARAPLSDELGPAPTVRINMGTGPRHAPSRRHHTPRPAVRRGPTPVSVSI